MKPRRRMLPVVVGGLVAAGAIAGFVAARGQHNGPSTGSVQAASDATAAALSARLETDGELLVAASSALAGNPRQPPAQLRAALRRVAAADRLVGVAAINGPQAAIVTSLPEKGSFVATDLASKPEWRLALDLARDRAGPGAFLDPTQPAGPTVIDVMPLFGAPDAPADIAARRASLQGFVFSATPVAAIIRVGPAKSDIAVQVSDGQTVLGAFGEAIHERPPDNAPTTAVTSNAVAWTVKAWATPSASDLPWVVLIGGFVLAIIVAIVVALREQSFAAAVAETNARHQELVLIAKTGPLLQQSLALGDLLPLFVVEVSDDLALDGISINLASDSGEMVRAFSLGSGAGPSVAHVDALGSAPARVGPGEIVTLPLIRVGRVVGAFQARAVAGLNEPQMETLLAVCALLAAAVGNVRLYQDEQDMVVRLRDLDRMKTRFIGSVSHELRTSVTAIQGFAGLLESGVAKIDEQTRIDYAERIGRNARSLSVLIEDLLDFARYERSGLAGELRPTDLSELVPNVVDQMSSVLSGRAVSTSIEPGVVAPADPLAIERILANLLSNAGKYSPPASPVEVSLVRNSEHAVLTVTDHGAGVPEAEREKIFELFYRSDESARLTRGVGIGLALARQLVEHLHGTIGVVEAPGGGARFCVTIPLATTATATAHSGG